MQSQSIEDNLQQIKNGIINNTDDDSTTYITINAINQFQNDPAILKPYLKQFITNINQYFIQAIDNNSSIQLPHTQAIFFYNLSKICSNKIVSIYLQTDISYLNPIYSLLSSKQPWETQFFLLSWCHIIIQAPFNIVNDKQIWLLTNKFENNLVLSHIVSGIHSTLYQKNYHLFKQHIDSVDLETLNKFLKTQLIESTSHILKDKPTLNKITQQCLNNVKLSEPIQLLTLKILPKLFLLQSYNENWDILSDIMEWYDIHLDSPYTEVRFMLAHSYAKILRFMINDLEGETQAIQCIEEIINDLLNLINNTPMDIIDIDTLHTYLLLIAEGSKFIIQYLPHLLLVVTNEILPLAYKFQQLHLGTMIKSSQVKDAANFIIWSWSRYPILPNSVVSQLIKYLLFTTLFDRDFLIRKSSNAALQELLGRHGNNILNNITIMNFIQLPIYNLHDSFKLNLIKLYNICYNDEQSPQGKGIFIFIVDWLLKQNVMHNFDLDIVMLSASSLCQFQEKDTQMYPFLHIIRECLDGFDYTKPLDCSKLLFLLTELSNNEIEQFHPEVIKLSQTIETTKFKINPSKNEYFQYLSLLRFWNICLNTNITIIEDIVSLFFKIISDINESSPWFDQFKSLSNQIFEKLDTEVTSSPEFWYQFEKLLKYNKPLICSSLPMLTKSRFMKYLNNYQPIFTCQSKSLIIATLTTNKDSFMKLKEDYQYIDIIIEWLNDHTITQQGDVGRLTREAACKLVSQRYDCFDDNDITLKLIPTLLYLAAEPSQNVRQSCIKILTDPLSKYFSEPVTIDGTTTTSHNIKLFNLQSILSQDIISRTFWRHYFTYAGALRATEEELMTGIDDFIRWYMDLDEDVQRRTLNNLIITIPSAQDIKNDKELMKYTICGLKFLERIWCSRCACGYVGFNWNGVFAKLYNITLLKNKQLLGAVLQILPTLAIAWKESVDTSEDHTFINKLIDFLVKLVNMNSKDEILKSELTPIQRNCVESLVGILFEFDQIEKVTHIQDFIQNYQPNSTLQTTQLLV